MGIFLNLAKEYSVTCSSDIDSVPRWFRSGPKGYCLDLITSCVDNFNKIIAENYLFELSGGEKKKIHLSFPSCSHTVNTEYDLSF